MFGIVVCDVLYYYFAMVEMVVLMSLIWSCSTKPLYTSFLPIPIQITFPRFQPYRADGGIVKYLSPATSTAIIRCPRASYRLVWSALTYMSRLPAPKGRGGITPAESPPDCVIRVVRVSGTMKKAEEEAIRRARREVLRMKKGSEESAMAVLDELFANDGVMDVDVVAGADDDGESDEDLDDEDD